LRAQAGRCGQHGHQGEERAHVQHRAELLQPPVVEQGEGGHHDDADDQERRLSLQEVLRVGAVQRQPTLVAE